MFSHHHHHLTSYMHFFSMPVTFNCSVTGTVLLPGDQEIMYVKCHPMVEKRLYCVSDVGSISSLTHIVYPINTISSALQLTPQCQRD